MNMEKDKTLASLFTNILHVKDQLVSIDVKMDDDGLLQIVIDRIPSSWETFLAAVNKKEENPNFKILWHDCIQ